MVLFRALDGWIGSWGCLHDTGCARGEWHQGPVAKPMANSELILLAGLKLAVGSPRRMDQPCSASRGWQIGSVLFSCLVLPFCWIRQFTRRSILTCFFGTTLHLVSPHADAQQRLMRALQQLPSMDKGAVYLHPTGRLSIVACLLRPFGKIVIALPIPSSCFAKNSASARGRLLDFESGAAPSSALMRTVRLLTGGSGSSLAVFYVIDGAVAASYDGGAVLETLIDVHQTSLTFGDAITRKHAFLLDATDKLDPALWPVLNGPTVLLRRRFWTLSVAAGLLLSLLCGLTWRVARTR